VSRRKDIYDTREVGTPGARTCSLCQRIRGWVGSIVCCPSCDAATVDAIKANRRDAA
jgi:hypothetical protein